MESLSNIKIKKINKDIVSIIIDEPKTYNALSFKNLNDLIKNFKKLDNDKNIKVIIIEGSGKGFSAGHNLKEVSGLKKKAKYPLHLFLHGIGERGNDNKQQLKYVAGLFINRQSGQLRLIKRRGHFNNRFLTVAIHH